MDRVKTGIQGFDKIIEGGLIKNSVNLLSGGTGTGKTIFCLQYLYNGAKDFDEKGIYISFEESEEDLKGDVAGLGLDFDGFGHKVRFVYIPPYDVTDFIQLLCKEIKSFKPERVVIDSTTALTMSMEDDFERRKQVFVLRETLKNMNCTSFLISEVSSDNWSETIAKFSRFDSEEFLADSVIVMHYTGLGGESDRAIRVVKMRKTNHIRGPVPMKIGKQGIKVGKSRLR